MVSEKVYEGFFVIYKIVLRYHKELSKWKSTLFFWRFWPLKVKNTVKILFQDSKGSSYCKQASKKILYDFYRITARLLQNLYKILVQSCKILTTIKGEKWFKKFLQILIDVALCYFFSEYFQNLFSSRDH